MTTTFTKVSQLPTTNTTNANDRLVILTSPNSNAILQTVSFAVAINTVSQNFINTASPIITGSLTVNSNFVANSLGVFTRTGFANVYTTNTLNVNNKLQVGRANGYDFGITALIEIDGSQNTYVQSVIQNANSGTNASGDLVITADTGNDSVNYVDFGINGSNYSNTQYTIAGALDAYLYSSNSNLVLGTAIGKEVIFHANGTTTADRKFTINATSVTVANSVNLIGNTANFANQVTVGSLYTNGSATIAGDLVVSGNLTLSGNTTFVNATVITTKDLNVVLANGALNALAADGAGIVVKNYANLVFDNVTNSWQSNVDLTPYSNNLNLGNTNNQWNLWSNQATISTLAVTNTFVLVGSGGSNLYFTPTQLAVGNSTSNTYVGNGFISFNSNVISTPTSLHSANVFYISNTTGNTSLTPYGLTISANGLGYVKFGNSSVNNSVNSSLYSIANSSSNLNLTTSSVTITNATVNSYLSIGSIAFNNTTTSTTVSVNSVLVGNSTVNTTVNSIAATFANNNGTLTVTPLAITIASDSANVSIGNSSVNTTSNSSYIITSGMTLRSNTFNLGSTPTVSTNGYSWLPNGLKMNWGVLVVNSSSVATFANSFGTNALSVQVTPIGTNYIGANTIYISGVNSTAAVIRSASTTTTANAYYLAIGY